MQTDSAKAKRRTENQKGVAIIEMALFMAGLSIMIVGLIDFGSIMAADIELSNCLRVGTQVAMAQPNNSSGITQSVKSGSTLPSNSVTSTSSTFCECDGAGVSCGFSCGGTMATFITINASYNVPLLMTYPGFNSFTLNKTVSVRVQ